MTALVLCVATGVIELATYMPVKGGTMSYFGTRYVSKSLGFAMGWLYWYSLCILVPYEITAAAVVSSPSHTPSQRTNPPANFPPRSSTTGTRPST